MQQKYKYLIFIIVLFNTAFIGAFAAAYNPDKYRDSDQDGLTDWEEKAIYQSFWDDADSDDDGYSDGVEVRNKYSPKHAKLKMVEADTDNDGLNDEWEIKLGSNLMVRDTDGDGYLDGGEVHHGYSPTNKATDKVEKRIEVDIKNFTLKYYFDDILLEEFFVSTGKPSTLTPIGEFTVIEKYPIKHYYGYPNTKWNLHFTTNPTNGLRYYIHGAYWHDKFGQQNVSGGCVNVPYKYMENLYNWAAVGQTKVIIF